MAKIQPDFSKGDGLVPAIIQDANSGVVLMLGYMNQEALDRTEETAKVHFFSRSKGRIWMKGETSENVLHLVSLALDCDSDTILVQVHPAGPTCHNGTTSCFGEVAGSRLNFLAALERVIASRKAEQSEKSYIASLFQSGTKKIAQKVVEEAGEIAIEAVANNKELFTEEAADLLFHYMVLLADQGLSIEDVAGLLQKRHQSRTGK